MAWTTPRTWLPGETVTSTNMNTHVRDNLNVLKTYISNNGLLLTLLFMDATAHTGSGTGETVASTYSLPGGTLATTGMVLYMFGWGKTAAGASTRTFKLTWNGGSLLTTTSTVASGIYNIDGAIARTGASSQSARVTFGAVTLGLNTATPATIPNIGTVWDSGSPVNAALSGAVTITTTLQDSAAGTNVTQLYFSVAMLTAS